jgi:hypothetical protein
MAGVMLLIEREKRKHDVPSKTFAAIWADTGLRRM